MTTRAIEERLHALKINRARLELRDPNAAMGHTGRRIDREIEALRAHLDQGAAA